MPLPDLSMFEIKLTYREIYVLLGLWSKHLCTGDSTTDNNGIGNINYAGLIRAGLVEYLNIGKDKNGVAELELLLAKTAIQQIQTEEYAGAAHSLEQIIQLPGDRWVYRLTQKGIEHLQAQPDAVPDEVNW